MANTLETNQLPFLSLVEFYLSDSNLPFDKFLFTLWSNSFNAPSPVVLSTPVPADYPTAPSALPFHHGWLPLEKLTSFKRMHPYLEAPPTGLGSLEAIVEAVKATSTLVEVHQMGKEGEEGFGWYVRRTTMLTRPEDAMMRSVYVKGFPATVTPEEELSPEEKEKVKATELDLQKKMEAWARSLSVGAIKSLRMRRETKPPPPDAKAGYSMAGRGPFKVSHLFSVLIFVWYVDWFHVLKGIYLHRIRQHCLCRRFRRS